MAFKLPKWEYLKYDIDDRARVVRKWINQRPKLITYITFGSFFILLVIVVSLAIPDRKTIPEKKYKKAWFYDLNTAELFIHKSNVSPPIEAPSGPMADGSAAGVRAYVFSYVTEPNEKERFIGFLETLSPQAKEHEAAFRESTEKITRQTIAEFRSGSLIRTLDDPNWYRADSDKARSIFIKVFKPDDRGRTPHYYLPK